MALLATAALLPILAGTQADARVRFHRTLPGAGAWTPPQQTWIVIDAQTGHVLEEHDADAPHVPASLTKMMTLYLAFEALQHGRITLATPMPVSAHAASMQPVKLGLPPGQTITLNDAIQVMTTRSANDIAVVVAEKLGGTEQNFARMMSVKAHQLGMIHTFFYNASGLPDDRQTTTARDMTILARALIRDFPQYYHYFDEPYYVYKGRTLYNTDHLLGQYPGMDGMKDGYTNAAGFNLVASAMRDGHRVIGVVLGGRTAAARNTFMASLLDQGFALDSEIASAKGMAPVGAKPAPVLRPMPVAATIPAPIPASPAPRITATFHHGLDLTGTAVAAEPTARDVDSLSPKAGSWAIQVGAFADINSSRRAVSRATEAAPSLLGQARPDVVVVSTGHGALYRARLTGLDENNARSACTQITRAGKDCLVVAPSAPQM